MSTNEQFQQEAEYWFPYHYISTMPNFGFCQHFVDTWGINYISTIEFILKKVFLIAPKSVVDIGCGDGRFSREVCMALPGCKITGLDYSERAINLARAMNQDIDRLEFRTCDILTYKSKEKFDLAILMEVFEHIPLDITDDFLRGVRSLVKDDGVLLITVPHSNKPVEYKHFQHFTLHEIQKCLDKHFDIQETVFFEKRCFARKLLNFALSNQFFVLNNKKLLNVLYRLYNRYLFDCATENECQRLFIKAIPRLS